MKTPWMIPAAALVIGAVGGYVTGQNKDSTTDSAVVDETSPRLRSSARAGSGNGGGDAAKRTARARSLEEISRMPGQSGRIQAMMDYYAGLSPDQMEEEARKLEGLPMSERMIASFLLFGRWAESDPMAAMAHSDTMGFAGAFVRPTILQSWASVDPENAARYYAENPNQFGGMGGGGPMGQSGAASIAGEWARQDPNAALAWANTLQGRDKNQALSAVVREVANTDPAKAAGLAATLDGDARGDAYRTIAGQWGSTNFSEAEVWIRSLPSDQQDAAMASALAGLSRENPQLAAQKVATMPAGDSRNEAVATLASNWGRQDPAAAVSWLMQQDSDEAKSRAMRDVIPTWTAQNDAAAYAFVNSQPSGQVRDSAASAYVFSNRSNNPGAVMKIAESIEDEGNRMRTVGMAAARWMQQDSAAATTYIQQSDSIPDRLKERITEGGGMDWGRGGGGGGAPGRGRGGRGD